MEFDFLKFFSVAVNGVPLILVVIGIVTWIKQLGLSGRGLQIASLVAGLILGLCYQASQGISANFAGWFAAIIYGLTLGLFASGIYDTGKEIISKALAKVFADTAKNKNESEGGQGLVEYALIIVLIAIVVIVVLALVGSSISNIFSTIASALGG